MPNRWQRGQEEAQIVRECGQEKQSSEEHPLNVPWHLSREETADNRTLSLCLPLGFELKPAPSFRICRCCDWLEMVSIGILKYCLRVLLGQEQRRVISLPSVACSSST